MDTRQQESNTNGKADQRVSQSAWFGRRIVSTLPVFVILLGLLVSISGLTLVPWKTDPTNQRIETLSRNTDVTFDNPRGVRLARLGDDTVRSRHITVDARRPSTGEVQHIRVNIREPQVAQSSNVSASPKLPAVVFMHGAGYGTCDDSFGDVAEDFSSAGFVTAVLDKPVWSTNDLTRDYPASAKAYGQVVDYLRSLPEVDPGNVGLYATSESTWISPYVIRNDKRIAFQILLSPMVYKPRHSLGFFIAQDFSLVGANQGYQSIVRRLFHIDSDMFGLYNLDVPVDLPEAYAVPTLVAYGSKDVMTAQVDDVRHIYRSARQAGNTNVTVRSYPVANHVLRLGDEAELGTPLADQYEKDATDWAVGTVAGLTQSSESVAGKTLEQSIAVPKELEPNRALTIYGVALHGCMLATLLVAILMCVAALVMKVLRLLHSDKRPVFGLLNGFAGALLAISITTICTLALFVAGLGQVILAVVRLVWGGAPTENPGVMNWSWPVIQVAGTAIVWAWADVVVRLVELARSRRIRLPHLPTGASWGDDGSVPRWKEDGRGPVLATTMFGRVVFWFVAAAMFQVLLFFAFWGIFVY
ncbi:alpha/beta hydrolase [Bifidobacterium bombi]|uniref:Alpha/beta hydrolase family n=1 Tax=Bifidobacterium bombi DSM 19703 TaxID=1341695 RepID=A0A080N248_9BIFI|nr:alpha/beta hydrolase [Bifidobacterium bombi]KFF31012.1 alpha/beta hydrolase family [Bifidobacterium bombi DSM 19703]